LKNGCQSDCNLNDSDSKIFTGLVNAQSMVCLSTQTFRNKLLERNKIQTRQHEEALDYIAILVNSLTETKLENDELREKNAQLENRLEYIQSKFEYLQRKVLKMIKKLTFLII
jgi:chromosome segregation ATPase